MLVYVDQLRNLDVTASIFLAMDIQNGWLKVANDSFGKILVDDLDVSDPRSSIHASQEDIVLEAEDLTEINYSFSSLGEVYDFANKIAERMEVVC